MNKVSILLNDFTENYKKSPGIFWKWFIYTFLVGTISVWVPLFAYSRFGYDGILSRILLSGNVSTFLIVVLADTIGFFEIQKRKDISINKAFPALIHFLLLVNTIYYAFIICTNAEKDVLYLSIIFLVTMLIILLSYAYKDIVTIDDSASDLVKDDDARVKHDRSKMSSKEKVNPIPPKRKK